MGIIFYLIILFWILGFIFLWKITYLRKVPYQTHARGKLSIIVPARNEEKNLNRLLASIDQQFLRPDEVIVVDDQSEDGTAIAAKKYGCKVIHSTALPPGWLGKSWACWQGANASVHDILMFLDADTFLEPEAISTVLSNFADKEGLLTVQPYHFMTRTYERLSAIFNIIVLAGMKAFTPYRSMAKPVGAFGPCIICRKKLYFEIGGHEIVKNQILENVALGKEFIKAGHNIHCYGGKGNIAFQMYPEGFRSMVEGFTKSFGIGAVSISPGILFMIVCWVFGGVSLTRHLIQTLFWGNLVDIIPWVVLDLLYAAQIHWMLVRIGNFGILTAFLFQLPLLFFVLVFGFSMLKTHVFRNVQWKGRMVSSDDERE